MSISERHRPNPARVTLTQSNFEVLSEEIFKVSPTYQNGAPNTVI